MEKGDYINTLGYLATLHEQAGSFLEEVSAQSDEILNDRICGSWIAVDGDYTLLIRKISGGPDYTAVLCSRESCYKVIERIAVIAWQKGKLILLGDDGKPSGGTVYYDEKGCTLRFGSAGRFEPEEEVLSRSNDYFAYMEDEI